MEIQNNQKANNKMTVVSPYTSITTLNINRLNSPIKRQRVDIWIKKQKTQLCATYWKLILALKTHSSK